MQALEIAAVVQARTHGTNWSRQDLELGKYLRGEWGFRPIARRSLARFCMNDGTAPARTRELPEPQPVDLSILSRVRAEGTA